MRLADRLLAHGLVRAKCNHDIERRHGSADPVENAFEKKPKGHVLVASGTIRRTLFPRYSEGGQASLITSSTCSRVRVFAQRDES